MDRRNAMMMKPGDNLYILDGYDLYVEVVSECSPYSDRDYYKMVWGNDDIQIVNKDGTSFSYGDKIVFLNKEDAITMLEGIIDEIKEYVKEAKK